MQASKEVWGKIFGTINTREKFLAKRGELAAREWARMKANDSLECRNCHSSDSMDLTRQSPRAADFHTRFLLTGEKTCIDCHKGIAHQLPDMSKVMSMTTSAGNELLAHGEAERRKLADYVLLRDKPNQ